MEEAGTGERSDALGDAADRQRGWLRLGHTGVANGQRCSSDALAGPTGLAQHGPDETEPDEANATSNPDTINDKMARYEDATHIETIEMLTGLRYRAGERSQGISTDDISPALIRGDTGIAIDKDGRGAADKTKKFKAADEYVCTDCGERPRRTIYLIYYLFQVDMSASFFRTGTLGSSEWRKGPSGPMTLCNA